MCANSARTGLCGGQRVTAVPTATDSCQVVHRVISVTLAERRRECHLRNPIEGVVAELRFLAGRLVMTVMMLMMLPALRT